MPSPVKALDMDVLPSPIDKITSIQAWAEMQAALSRRREAAQPIPLDCAVETIDRMTMIARTWADGDTGRCRLCPACAFVGRSVCLVWTEERVEPGQEWLYRLGPPDGGPALCLSGA